MKHTALKRLLPMLLIVWLALSGCEADDPWEETFYHSDLYVAGTNITANLTSLSANATLQENRLNSLNTTKANLAGGANFTGNLSVSSNTSVNTTGYQLRVVNPVVPGTGNWTLAGLWLESAFGDARQDSFVTTKGQAGLGGFLELSGRVIDFFTGYQPYNSRIRRLRISEVEPTAIATWTATTQTWSSYGAGTLVTDANGVVSASSDARLKNIVGGFNRGLRAILNIVPVQFRWKPSLDAETGLVLNDAENVYAGFSAQQVKQYLPEAVGLAPDGNYTLSDRALIAALVNSVKELQLQIDVLNAQLKLPAYSRNVTAIEDDGLVIKSKPEGR